MITENYVRLDSTHSEIDLDAVVDVADGWSQIKPGWQALIVYSPREGCFIELMNSMPDVRGNSNSQSVEVSAEYVQSVYGLTLGQISQLQNAPSQWAFVKRLAS